MHFKCKVSRSILSVKKCVWAICYVLCYECVLKFCRSEMCLGDSRRSQTLLLAHLRHRDLYWDFLAFLKRTAKVRGQHHIKETPIYGLGKSPTERPLLGRGNAYFGHLESLFSGASNSILDTHFVANLLPSQSLVLFRVALEQKHPFSVKLSKWTHLLRFLPLALSAYVWPSARRMVREAAATAKRESILFGTQKLNASTRSWTEVEISVDAINGCVLYP